MSYCCSQCSFKAQFESALLMHHQLHHEKSHIEDLPTLITQKLKEKSKTHPQASPPSSLFSNNKHCVKQPSRTLSATRMLGKLKARIYKSKTQTLFAHPETPDTAQVAETRPDGDSSCLEEQKEIYACHLCSFEADRITVLDRHLLNDHKIGLENLLKLVMSKTKDGLTDENSTIYGIRQPYYRPQKEMIEEGEFIIETVTPTIKILKHASTNTDDETHKDLTLEMNCQMISDEIECLLSGEKKYDHKEFLVKMRTLNDCMSKFVNSSNALKKVLKKEFDTKMNENYGGQPFFDLGLGDRESPRYLEKAHSEKMERSRHKYMDNCRADTSKPSPDSFYF